MHAVGGHGHSVRDSEGGRALVREADEFEILQAVADGITVQEPSGALAWANEAAARAMGYGSADKLMATPISEVMKNFELFQESGDPFPIELLPGRQALAGVEEPDTVVGFRIVESGEFRWSIVKAKPVFDDDGQVKYAVNIFHDITDRKRTDQQRLALLEAEMEARSQAEQAAKHLARLQAVTSSLADTVTSGQVADVIVDQAMVALDAAACLVLLTGKDGTLAIEGWQGYEDSDIREWDHMTVDMPLPITEAIRTGKPVAVQSRAERDARYPILATVRNGFNASVSLPLIVEGKTLGALGLSFADERRFSPDEKSLMLALAQQCAQALERSRLYEAEQTSRENLEFLAETSRVLGSSLDYRKTLSHVAELVVPHLADWCVIDLTDEQPGVPHQLTVAHADPKRAAQARDLRRRYPSRDGEGSARVISTGEPEVIPRIEDDMLRMSAQDDEHLELLRDLGLRSAMVVPLRARGRIFGAITFASSRPEKEYGKEDLVLAEDMARRAAMAVDNARLFQEAQQAAERHRSLIQSVDAIVWEGDAETLRFTFVSQRARDMLGYPLGRWTSDPNFWSERVHPDDRERVMGLYEAALATGLDQEIEYRAIAADGRELWLRDFVHVTKDASGKPRALRGLTVDISGRKVVEMRLQESNARFAYLARTLQQSLLPPELPTIPGVEIAARYRAAGKGNEVGGDFYDLFDTEEGEWVAVMGDVRGKGAKAAALTGLARHTIRAAAMQGLNPEGVLNSLNAALQRHEVSDDSAQFCTVTYTLLQQSAGATKRMKIVSGGHPLPLVLRADGKVEEVGIPGMLLGVVPDPELQEAEVELNVGDAIMLYTDGVTDGRREGELFGEQRLRAVFGSCIGMNAEEIADLVERSVVDFWSDEPLDDIAILVLKVRPAR